MRFVVSDTTQKEAIGCPRCKTAMQEVARIKPLQQAQGLIAYACPSCRYTFSETLPAPDVRNNLAHMHRPTGLVNYSQDDVGQLI